MDVSSASFAYPRLDGATRARVAKALLGADRPPAVFVLSTCLRVEVAVGGDETVLKEALQELFEVPPIDPVVRVGADAVDHLFRVASGLESPIVGETEVLSQFRQALADLKAAGPVEGGFLKLLESAVATGRSARDLIGTSPHDTMAALAAQLVGGSPEVAVIGSGAMAAAVVTALAGLPAPPRVTLVARNPQRATVGDIEMATLDSLDNVLAGFPAVVSATAASARLVDEDRLQAAIDRRRSPLTLVDMAMPPDFSAPLRGEVRYVGIDDLAELALRRGRTDDAGDHVAEAAAEAHHRYTGKGQVGPLIQSMLATADGVVDETVEKFAGRLADPADQQVLRQAVHTAARALMDRPLNVVRTSRDPRVVEAIATAFEDE